jgi:hypothetical protein
VASGGKAAHVHVMSRPTSARITCAAVRPSPATRIQPVDHLDERGDQLVELVVQLGDVGVHLIDPGQQLGQQERVMVGEDPVNASSRTLRLARNRPRASWASTFGSRSPAISAASIARPETPKMSAATTLSLTWASSSSFSPRCLSAVRTPTRSIR